MVGLFVRSKLVLEPNLAARLNDSAMTGLGKSKDRPQPSKGGVGLENRVTLQLWSRLVTGSSMKPGVPCVSLRRGPEIQPTSAWAFPGKVLLTLCWLPFAPQQRGGEAGV